MAQMDQTAHHASIADLRALLQLVLTGALDTPGLALDTPGLAVAGGLDSPAGPTQPGSSSLTSQPRGWLLQHSHHASAQTASPTTSPAHRAGSASIEVDDRIHDAEGTRLVALVDLAQRGDPEAFGQLYDHYVSTVYRYVYYRVGAHALAEDLTSETFLRALRALGSFRWRGRDFGAWLVTIARNLITDHFKSGRFRLEVTTEQMLDHDSTADGPEHDVLASLTNETLFQAVKQLGADQQECLVLRFLNGLSVAETAKVLGKSEGAVKQLQLRAVRNLSKLLPEDLR